MKKFLIAGFFLLSLPLISKADPICTNWSTLNICVPFSSADIAYGFAFLNNPETGEQMSENQLLAETQIGSIKKLAVNFGASKGAHFSAAPYVGIGYDLPKIITNPVTAFDQFLSDIQPGIYVGNSNLHRDGWFYGIKTSKQIW